MRSRDVIALFNKIEVGTRVEVTVPLDQPHA